MGSILQDKGDMKQAEEYYLRAIRQNPDFLDARGNLAILYNRNGRAGEAEKVLNYVAGRAVNERPDLLPIALYHLGEVYRSEGRLAEAVSAWRRTVEIAPSFKAAKKRLDEVSGKNVSGKH
jgi:tetratricopeptide (TPR) repeat protein